MDPLEFSLKKLPIKSLPPSKALGAEISQDPFDLLAPVLKSFSFHHPKDEVGPIEEAWKVAREKHEGQFRASGEPYISHPLGVAQILADLGSDRQVVMAGLLHDTVEDTDYSLEECRRQFGETASLVEGVTKLSLISKELSNAETIRKLILAMQQDVRVGVVKLADRLYNARTWRFMPPKKAAKKAGETLDIYVPLADRLGMGIVKSELEELSFKYLDPKIYKKVVEMVGARAGVRDEYLEKMMEEVKAALKSYGIKAKITGRLKSYFSIYRKIVLLKKNFDRIYDFVGIRVVVDSPQNCYRALGIIHEKWLPVPGRFKDYIAMPKSNLYQALHTTILGDGGQEIEIQIRTEEMHKEDEYGIAAHWKYKEKEDFGSPEWVGRMANWVKDLQDPSEILPALKSDLTSEEISIFTPKGETIFLPEGACPLDFAYAVHTEIGNRAVGAKINGIPSSLSSKLKSGDCVEILTSQSGSSGPSYEWLSFVITPKAKNKIKRFLSQEKNLEAAQKGKKALMAYMLDRGIPFSLPSLVHASSSLGFSTLQQLYYAVGNGKISCFAVSRAVFRSKASGEGSESEKYSVTVKGVGKGERIELARCCKPVPGDQIAGFITNFRGVRIHSTRCPDFIRLSEENPGKIVDAQWKGEKGEFEAEIEVLALDRQALLVDLSLAISNACVDLSSSRQKVAANLVSAYFSFKFRDFPQLELVIKSLEQVEGVIGVKRVGG
ncbi:MAG: bifunctional (p)ppGpp synthetase/guanosine-3',5'-bis(diphosphate) 3'-pyrophosphohydrolase [Aeriscardovia sp.]|nr:bifunctional (p)ppGpp synthetase/guanosine-3',5'-bis(diphosphate) 3'-pyrophosphohydrolase [Aeriscardovia sp.]